MLKKVGWVYRLYILVGLVLALASLAVSDKYLDHIICSRIWPVIRSPRYVIVVGLGYTY
jgi:hypothetical protein